jgi:hypothetical protein
VTAPETEICRRWELIVALDDELLRGGVLLAESSSALTRSADIAFTAGAFLASILAAVAAIETHLRSECENGAELSLANLIEQSGLDDTHIAELHALRIRRNRCAHVKRPWDETGEASAIEDEALLENSALQANSLMRRTLYSHQFV